MTIVTDLDNRPETGDSFLPFNKLEGKSKTKYENLLMDKENYKLTNINLELAKEWTLEWCLYKSPCLSGIFKESLKKVHPTIFKTSFGEFIPMLKKESSSKLDKVKLASTLAQKIEETEALLIDEKDDYIKYLVDSIKHACSYEN